MHTLKKTPLTPPGQVAAAGTEDGGERGAVWSRYWARGAMHSCGGSYQDEYGGSMGRFWLQRFGGLPQGARILDVGTGNGALVRLFNQASEDVSATCDAIDLAQVAPAWLDHLPAARRARLRFHGHCSAESLPFADGAFDMVVSQYALEYCRLDLAIPELCRVLGSRGEVAFVMHHAEGRPARLGAIEVAHLEWLLADAGLLRAVSDLLAPMSMARTASGRAALAGDQRANAQRDAFNSLQDALDARAAKDGGDGADVLFEARQAAVELFAIAAEHGLDAAQAAWRGWHGALQDSLFRLRELCTHALGHHQIQLIRSQLQAAGLMVEVSLLEDQQHVMGWALHGGAAGH